MIGILAEKWSNGFGVHMTGITFGDGRIVLFSCHKIKSEKTMSTIVSPIAETTLASVLKYNDDPWVHLTELDRLEVKEKNLRLSCGEGAMGNEGYAAVSELESGKLLWMAFFSCSNPFSDIRYENNNFMVENTYEQEWNFPLDKPEALTIRGLS